MTRRLSIFAVVAALAIALTPAVIGRDSKSGAPGDARSAPSTASFTVEGSVATERRARARTRDVKPATERDSRSASLAFAEPRNFSTGANPSARSLGHNGDDPALTHAPVTDSVAVGNFDEDATGHLDVVQTNVLAGSISVLRGDGDGFSAPTVIPVGVNPALVVARHLDRDTHLDLVIADPGSLDPTKAKPDHEPAVITLRGDGRGGFAISNTIALSVAPRDLALGDLNGDRITDIAVATRRMSAPFVTAPTEGGVTILNGALDGSGAITFNAGQTVILTKDNAPVGANAVAVGDFDGKGAADLAVAVGTMARAGDQRAPGTEPEGDDFLVYLNRNTGSDPFELLPSQRFRVGPFPEAIAAADWNDDAHLDLAVLNSQRGDVTSFTNDGRGHFTLRASTASVGALARSLKVADFDNDGVSDLVTATYYMSTVSVLAGRGDGTFNPPVDFWAGDEPTAVEAGLFDGDKRADIVAGRLQTDELALLVNETPKPADGVVATRDIPYVTRAVDPAAAQHTLDVWAPAKGTRSFAGRGKPYPVFMFAHGGQGLAGDKAHVSYLMRTLAQEGIVAITINYRLDGTAHWVFTGTDDYADAIRWVRANIGAARFGGDPDDIVIAGTSTGAAMTVKLATAPIYAKLRPNIRALVVVGAACDCDLDATTGLTPPPSLALAGDQGGEGGDDGNAKQAQKFVAAVQARGVYGKFVQVPGHDHFEVVSNLARRADLGRDALLEFLRKVLG